jgi:nicotinamide mononucleotide transporter
VSETVTILLSQLQATSWQEWLSLVTGIGYAVLAVRHSRWCWVSGGVSSLLLIWLAARAQLPMQAAMQSVYVLFAIYGFWRWSPAAGRAAVPPVSTLPPIVHGVMVALMVLAVLTLAPALGRYTEAAWPRADTAVMLVSFYATWLTAASKLENWLYWIAVNAASTALYGSRGLLLVALLYLVYGVIAVVGWREWRKMQRMPRATP